LTVVFNAITACMRGEPFLKRDVLGIVFIIFGVLCVVWSQVTRSPPLPAQPPAPRAHAPPLAASARRAE
jgi:drug/metabolite transporter (DMT)-like permease